MAPTSTSEMDPNFSEYFPAQIFPNKPTVACTSPRITSSERSHSRLLPSRWRRPSPLYPESDGASKGEYGIGVSHKKAAWAPSVTTPSSSQVGKPLPPGSMAPGGCCVRMVALIHQPERSELASAPSAKTFNAHSSNSSPFFVVDCLPGTLGSFPSIHPVKANPASQAFFHIFEPE